MAQDAAALALRFSLRGPVQRRGTPKRVLVLAH